jgi:hypothetical protein
VSTSIGLKTLDACLARLEAAHERGEKSVSAALCNSVSSHVPAVRPGMLIALALEATFKEQERWLTGLGGGAADRSGRPAGGIGLTAEEARALTARIKQEGQQLSLLLAEAHERKAWRALGYRSWGAYIREEFGMSRSRSYELLVHAEVATSLKRAAGLDTLPPITPIAALTVRPRLEIVLEEVARRTSVTQDKSDVEAIVLEVVQRARLPRTKSRRIARETSSPSLHISLNFNRLGTILEYLASLPSAAECAQECAASGIPLPGLEAASTWLSDFARSYCRELELGPLRVHQSDLKSGAA